MSRFHSYINSSLDIVSKYDGSKPFSIYVKQVFSLSKKFGSRDRKSISEICYCWFRVARLFGNEPGVENLQKAIFLCSHQSSPLLANVSPELNQRADETPEQKLAWLGLDPGGLFPFAAALGEGIDAAALAVSYLQQPDLFIRSRPGKKEKVADKLMDQGIPFEKKLPDCFALANSTKLDEILDINIEAVIQDKNSQRVFDHLPATNLTRFPIKVWDCCAASGGKSILVFDRLKKPIQLTVSDIRKTILHNCIERLQQASVPVHQHFVADLSQPSGLPIAGDFDIIICDAPCSGSGTWGRTPEQLAYFDPAVLPTFSSLQKSIAGNVVSYLAAGGFFVYITCSVFKAENEDVVEALLQQGSIELMCAEYLTGYHEKADTMYVAIFKKQ